MVKFNFLTSNGAGHVTLAVKTNGMDFDEAVEQVGKGLVAKFETLYESVEMLGHEIVLKN